MPDLVRPERSSSSTVVDKYGFPRRAAEDRADLSRQSDEGRTARSTASRTTATSLSCIIARTCSGPHEPEGIQSQIRLRPGGSEDLEGVRRDRQIPDRNTRRKCTAPFSSGSRRTPVLFQERFRVEGGKFFDPKTMKATVNSDIGVKVFDDMRADKSSCRRASRPGASSKH